MLSVLGACAVEEWRNADVQLDVEGAEADDEEVARICVAGAGVHEEAIGPGTVAFPGLPASGELAVAVDIVAGGVRRGSASATFRDEDWASAAWEPCEGDCPVCEDAGARVPEGDPDRLLAVRFR